MTETIQTKRGDSTLSGVLLAIGLIVGGWILGAQIKATRLADRYVTVKGLVERNVKSDLTIWTLTYKEAGDDLSVVYAKSEADKKTVLEFLAQQGIQSSEIELGVVRVVDTQANEYGGGNARHIAILSSSRLPYVLRESIRWPPRRKNRCSCCRKASS